MDNQTYMLTAKQKAVFELLSRGLIAKEVACKLDMTQTAVEKHVKKVRAKFGGVTTLRAMVLCIQHNLVTVAD